MSFLNVLNTHQTKLKTGWVKRKVHLRGKRNCTEGQSSHFYSAHLSLIMTSQNQCLWADINPYKATGARPVREKGLENYTLPKLTPPPTSPTNLPRGDHTKVMLFRSWVPAQWKVLYGVFQGEQQPARVVPAMILVNQQISAWSKPEMWQETEFWVFFVKAATLKFI